MNTPNTNPMLGKQSPITLAQFLNAPTNGMYPTYAQIKAPVYLDNKFSEEITLGAFSKRATVINDGTVQYDWQNLTSTGWFEKNNNETFQYPIVNRAYLYLISTFSHEIRYDIMTKLTEPRWPTYLSTTMKNALQVCNDAENLYQIFNYGMTLISLGQFIVTPQVSSIVGINQLQSDTIFNMVNSWMITLSQKVTTWNIMSKKSDFKLLIAEKLKYIFLKQTMIVGSDEAYQGFKKGEFVNWLGITNIKSSLYLQNPRQLSKFNNTTGSITGTQKDRNINKVLDYSIFKKFSAFIYNEEGMIGYRTEYISPQPFSIAEKTTAVDGYIWQADYSILPPFQPYCFLLLNDTISYQDYLFACYWVTNTQSSMNNFLSLNSGKFELNITKDSNSNITSVIITNDGSGQVMEETKSTVTKDGEQPNISFADFIGLRTVTVSPSGQATVGTLPSGSALSEDKWTKNILADYQAWEEWVFGQVNFVPNPKNELKTFEVYQNVLSTNSNISNIIMGWNAKVPSTVA